MSLDTPSPRVETTFANQHNCAFSESIQQLAAAGPDRNGRGRDVGKCVQDLLTTHGMKGSSKM